MDAWDRMNKSRRRRVIAALVRRRSPPPEYDIWTITSSSTDYSWEAPEPSQGAARPNLTARGAATRNRIVLVAAELMHIKRPPRRSTTC